MKRGEEDFTEFEMKGFLKGFSGCAVVMNSPGNAGEMSSIPAQEDPLEIEMAAHSDILAWEIPWTEEPGGL